jgi:hypothetical protein
MQEKDEDYYNDSEDNNMHWFDHNLAFVIFEIAHYSSIACWQPNPFLCHTDFREGEL